MLRSDSDVSPARGERSTRREQLLRQSLASDNERVPCSDCGVAEGKMDEGSSGGTCSFDAADPLPAVRRALMKPSIRPGSFSALLEGIGCFVILPGASFAGEAGGGVEKLKSASPQSPQTNEVSPVSLVSGERSVKPRQFEQSRARSPTRADRGERSATPSQRLQSRLVTDEAREGGGVRSLSVLQPSQRTERT